MQDGLGAVQSVLVLGGPSDIARSTLRRLVQQRTRAVVLAGPSPDQFDDVVAELRSLGATRVDSVAFDTDQFEMHQAFVDDVFTRFGEIDLVLVAFGVLGDRAAAERDPATATEIARVNDLAAVSVLHPIAERLRAQGHGVIVALSSVAGEGLRPSPFIHGSSKAGLDVFLQGLSDRLAGSGVQVLIVRAGFVYTKMTDGVSAVPLAVGPDAVAEAMLDGIASRRAIVWVPSVLRYAGSFLRHLPRPIVRRLAR
jgi:decaprenylphospho-beta-D-erythro-pentofuranosid-2-ulose 2-reductase